MKIMHLADLHIGMKLNEFSLLEDQKYILKQILDIAAEEKPEAVVIAGDIYDKFVPPAEAVAVADDFLTSLAAAGAEVFVISGNHDSADRIAFGSKLMEKSGVHMSPVYRGEVTPVTLSDEYGEVNFYMLPFISPYLMRRYAAAQEHTEDNADIADNTADDPEAQEQSETPKKMTYNDEVKLAVERMSPDYSQRNVIISHQAVTGGQRSESEHGPIGGLENVDAEVYEKFDYAALGHLHRPQEIEGYKNICYSGTPLKYSLSESGHDKSVTIAELAEKGSLTVRTVPLEPLRDMRRLPGTLEELLRGSSDDYLYIELTDETPVFDPAQKLRPRYPNILSVTAVQRSFTPEKGSAAQNGIQQLPPDRLFEQFFELRTGKPMTDEQRKLVSGMIEKIWEEKDE